MPSLFEQELTSVSKRITEYLDKSKIRGVFEPEDILESVSYYVELGGKRLRPAILLFSCGAVGGDTEKAVPAAAAAEVWHNFTLVHDDIIDQDEKRRHRETVHVKWAQRAKDIHGWSEDVCRHFGVTIGVLTGDAQQGWAVAKLIPDLTYSLGVEPRIALKIVYYLDYVTLAQLVKGETLDVIYSRLPIDRLNEKMVIEMITGKTAALFKFCGIAGAMIGLNTDSEEHPYVRALGDFTNLCGIAFQIQDDILGVTADEKELGKPVGSDIIRGNRTIPLLWSFSRASPQQKKLIEGTLGNLQANREDVDAVIDLMKDLGGIEHASEVADSYVAKAGECLDPIPESKYKALLASWAEFMTGRKF